MEHIAWCDSIHKVDKLVILSINFLLQVSTIRLKWCKKSASIIALLTSALINSHLNARLNLRSTVKIVLPYVLLTVLFAANNLRSVALLCFALHGIIETSDPVSIRNYWPDTLSDIIGRWLMLLLIKLWQSKMNVSNAALVDTISSFPI